MLPKTRPLRLPGNSVVVTDRKTARVFLLELPPCSDSSSGSWCIKGAAIVQDETLPAAGPTFYGVAVDASGAVLRCPARLGLTREIAKSVEPGIGCSATMVLKLGGSVTACTLTMDNQLIIAGPTLSPSAISARELKSASLQSWTTLSGEPTSAVAMENGFILFGHANGEVTDVTQKTLISLGASIACLLQYDDSVIAVSAKGEITSLKLTSSGPFVEKRTSGTLRGGPVRSTLLLKAGTVLVHWTKAGQAFCSRVSNADTGLKIIGESQNIPVAGARVITAEKLSDSEVVLVLSNNTWIVYMTPEFPMCTGGLSKTKCELSPLLMKLKNFRHQELQLERDWSTLNERARRVAFAAALNHALKSSSQKGDRIRLIKGCLDILRIEIDIPKVDQVPASAFSVVLHCEHGYGRRETLARSVTAMSRLCAIEFQLDLPRSAERLFPIRLRAYVVVTFTHESFSHLLAERSLDLLDTEVLVDEHHRDDDSFNDDFTKQARITTTLCTCRVLCLKREDFLENVFAADRPAERLLRTLLPQSMVITGTSPFRAFSLAGQSRIQTEIDGGMVELKVVCPDTLTAACLRAALIRRTETILRQSVQNQPLNLSTRRAILNAQAVLESLGPAENYSWTKNEQIRAALEGTIEAWLFSRQSHS